MNSLSYSLQDVPSSITQTITDEFDTILMDLQGFCLDTFERKYQKRMSTFSSIRSEEKKIQTRLQELPNKLKNSTEGIQRRIDRLTAEVGIKEEEGAALETRCKEQIENVQRKQAEIGKLQEKEKLMIDIVETLQENASLIKSGSDIIRRIDKRCPCPHPG
ncbi:hypothetical protein Y032_0019g3763 [Ancylostoma ceylanicum]|uniref:Uncharacterized protein n=1 Tax=Ancylostoma ceylanicum TaxID=53326 RepID=A0A016V3M5_9BILA|nr:hypothetical protein Y032_0019g3763 [Ancylostoma ceylanicum]